MSSTYPDGSQQSNAYDKGRLSQITLPDQSRIRYTDYQWMQPTRIETPGAAKTQTFDALQRHTRIEVRNNASQLLASKSYQYDLAGNITQIDSDQGNTQYGYDKLSRLTQASPDTRLKSLGLPQEQYSYDPVGNRTGSAHQPGVWSYNGDNQLTQYPRTTPFSGAPAQNTQVTYTPQGHTQSEQSGAWQRDYRYNAAERLIETSQNGQSTSYRYDPFGRRISKTTGSGAGSTTTTYYLYSDTGLMAEADSQGNLTKAYGFNPRAQQQGLWSTDPMWQADVRANSNSLTDRATSYHYLHTDHLATPTLATDKTGSTTWKGASEAFGATTTTIKASEMNLRFPGQYWDRETNSHYNLNRDYLHEAGRYIQSDPIGMAGGVNFYGYVDAKPIAAVDPEGLQWTTVDSYCRQNPKNCILPAPGIPVPIVPPKQEEKKCEKCTDYPYSRYVPCDNLHMYAHNSFSSAYAELRMINGGGSLNRGKSKPAERGPCGVDTDYVTGQHIVFTSSQVGRAGSLVSCECCEQRSDGVLINEKWGVIP